MRVTTTTSGLSSPIRNAYREKKVSVGGVVGIPIRESVAILGLVSLQQFLELPFKRVSPKSFKSVIYLQYNYKRTHPFYNFMLN